ncbi:MAG: GntR family transcriptional regulator [Defluviitaleaceae bacterium]|nr:GntR family transcriptional regulator [Defluviitaleaceae bacterium]
MLYPGTGKPLFEQLRDTILQMIEQGKYKPGDPIPSERELAEQYAVSRVTVRQALNSLVHDGVVTKKQGKGNFVATKRIETKLDSLLGFVEEFAVQGIECSISVIKQGYEMPPSEIVAAMGAENDPEMFLLVRNINVDGKALGVDYTYIPRSVAYQFDQMDFRKVIVYRLLEQQGYKLLSAEQTITAEMPTPQDCTALGINAKVPMLVRCRVAYVEGNLPIAYSRTLYRGDRYRYSLTLSRYAADDLHIRHTL